MDAVQIEAMSFDSDADSVTAFDDFRNGERR